MIAAPNRARGVSPCGGEKIVGRGPAPRPMRGRKWAISIPRWRSSPRSSSRFGFSRSKTRDDERALDKRAGSGARGQAHGDEGGLPRPTPPGGSPATHGRRSSIPNARSGQKKGASNGSRNLPVPGGPSTSPRVRDASAHEDLARSRLDVVEYLMMHSERIGAIREGRETESEQRGFLAEGIALLRWTHLHAAWRSGSRLRLSIDRRRCPAAEQPGLPAEQERREPMICEDERNNAEAAAERG